MNDPDSPIPQPAEGRYTSDTEALLDYTINMLRPQHVEGYPHLRLLHDGRIVDLSGYGDRPRRAFGQAVCHSLESFIHYAQQFDLSAGGVELWYDEHTTEGPMLVLVLNADGPDGYGWYDHTIVCPVGQFHDHVGEFHEREWLEESLGLTVLDGSPIARRDA